MAVPAAAISLHSSLQEGGREAQPLPLKTPPPWPEFSHMTTASHKAGWEVVFILAVCPAKAQIVYHFGRKGEDAGGPTTDL